MLLDNHYGPDARVAFEIGLLRDVGITTTIVAWDRRSAVPERVPGEPNGNVVRIGVPAPSGGGWRTFVQLARFARRVWKHRLTFVEGVSLLYVHDVYLLPLGWALARNLRIPFVYDAHEEFARAEAGRYPPVLRRFVGAAEGRLARGAAAVVVPGTSRTFRWQGVIESRPIVVPNFVQREQAPKSATVAEWDVLYAGTISPVRRLDLLVGLARRRTDLRIAVAGRGREVNAIEAAAHELPNLTFLGWQGDVDGLLDRSRSVYYGLDPTHPYSDVACPNTLYQTLRHRRPLIFFCGGEPAELAREFNIGIRCAATVEALEEAVDRVLATNGWQFDEAWKAVWHGTDIGAYAPTIRRAAEHPV